MMTDDFKKVINDYNSISKFLNDQTNLIYKVKHKVYFSSEFIKIDCIHGFKLEDNNSTVYFEYEEYSYGNYETEYGDFPSKLYDMNEEELTTHFKTKKKIEEERDKLAKKIQLDRYYEEKARHELKEFNRLNKIYGNKK